jgi:hypothetical protein
MELEGAAAVAAVESATMSLVSDLRDVEGALAAEQLRRGELLAYNGQLQGERRSRASFQSAQTGRNAIVLAEFDPLNQTPFDFVSDAGRKRLSRNMQVLKRCLAGLCVAPRGSAERLAATAGTPLTASVAKCKTLVSMFLEQMLPALGPDVDPELGFDDVLSYLPQRLQDFVKTLRCIVDSLRRAFAILKYCRGKEARASYHVLCAGVACELVAEGDRSGMARKVTESLGIPRAPGSVFRRQQPLRAAWDRLVALSGRPLQLEELVDCAQGRGIVKALELDGSITIQLDYGKSARFTSKGIPFIRLTVLFLRMAQWQLPGEERSGGQLPGPTGAGARAHTRGRGA